MASCLYFIQISLYQKQFDVARKNIQDVNILAECIALLHVPYFLKSPLAICAHRHDREFGSILWSTKAVILLEAANLIGSSRARLCVESYLVPNTGACYIWAL